MFHYYRCKKWEIKLTLSAADMAIISSLTRVPNSDLCSSANALRCCSQVAIL